MNRKVKLRTKNLRKRKRGHLTLWYVHEGLIVDNHLRNRRTIHHAKETTRAGKPDRLTSVGAVIGPETVGDTETRGEAVTAEDHIGPDIVLERNIKDWEGWQQTPI